MFKKISPFLRSILLCFLLIQVTTFSFTTLIKVKAAPTINIASTIVSDGESTFDANNNPGNDSSSNNGIVRTNDYSAIKTDISVNGGVANNVRVFFPYIDYNSTKTNIYIVSGCISYVYSSTGLTCSLGTISATTGGVTSSITVKMDTPSAFGNAYTMNITPTVSSTETGVINSNTVNITTSSTPKLDLFISASSYAYTLGSAGEPGFRVPINISTDSYLKGSESIQGGYSFNASIQYLSSGSGFQGAKLYTWGNAGSPACSLINFTCTQAGGAGSTVTITSTVSGVTYNNIPSINMWIPMSDLLATGTNSLTYKATVSNFDPNGISGASNFGTGIEPLANNESTSSIIITAGSQVNKYSYGTGSSITPNVDVVIPEKEFTWSSRYSNTSTSIPLNNIVICDKLDTTKQIFQSASVINNSTGSELPNAVIEYSVSPITPNYASATCDDSDGPWYTNIANIPGGINATTRVRGKNINNLAISNSVSLSVKVKPLSLANGTEILNTSSFKSNEVNNGNWVYASAKVVFSRIFTTVSKRSDAYFGSNSVAAGGSMGYTIDNTVIGTPGSIDTTNIEITDILPVGQSYLADPANTTPSSITFNGNGTTTLKWNYPNTPINYFTRSIYYKVRIGNTIPGGTILSNTAYVYSPDLYYYSPLNQPCPNAVGNTCAVSNITVQNSNTFYIQSNVNQAYIQQNQPFSYNIQYGNLTSNAIANTDLIDILPYNGDSRTPATVYTGTLGLNSVTGLSSSETLFYTKATPNTTNSDPCHVSNVSSGLTSTPTCVSLLGGTTGTGSTVWCTSLSGGSCPANLGEVTGVRVRSVNLPANSSKSFVLSFTTTSNTFGNTYTNFALARASNLSLPVYSNNNPVVLNGGTISGKIWKDTNNNNLYDLGDGEGIPSEDIFENITVTLSNGTTTVNGTTNSSGIYTFTNLPTGTYTVTATKPVGNLPTFDKDGVATPNVVSSQVITFDPNLGSNTINDVSFAYQTGTIPTDLTIRKQSSGGSDSSNSTIGSMISGSNSSYTITVKNLGTEATFGDITITDTIPTNMTYLSSSGTGWTCTYTSGTRLLSCSSTTSIAVNQDSIPLVVSVKVG
jgi:uncharacterized repeat protein (TIGR01451 family)